MWEMGKTVFGVLTHADACGRMLYICMCSCCGGARH